MRADEVIRQVLPLFEFWNVSYNGFVLAQILATKLFIPPLRPKMVLRPRLIEQLKEGLSSHRKLTLISASAGFSKTTLVSEWIVDSRRPTAWLSLDKGDNDPACFLTYLVAALQTIAPNIGAGALAVLQSPSTTLHRVDFDNPAQ